MSEGQRTCAFQKFLKNHPRHCSGIPHLLANLPSLSEASGICNGVAKREMCHCLPSCSFRAKEENFSPSACALLCATKGSQARIMANEQCVDNEKGTAFRSRSFCWQTVVILAQRPFMSSAATALRVHTMHCRAITSLLVFNIFYDKLSRYKACEGGSLPVFITDTH